MHADQRYIDALLSNDNRLLNELYQRFSGKIKTWVMAHSGSAHDAADVMQESLIAITRQAQREKGLILTCPFEAYLLMVCRGRWLNELRKRGKGVTIGIDEGFTSIDQIEQARALADDTLLEEARDRLFEKALKNLPEKCQKILQLSWSGMHMEQVGKMLEMTYAFVRKRKHECVAMLTKFIHQSPEFAALR